MTAFSLSLRDAAALATNWTRAAYERAAATTSLRETWESGFASFVEGWLSVGFAERVDELVRQMMPTERGTHAEVKGPLRRRYTEGIGSVQRVLLVEVEVTVSVTTSSVDRVQGDYGLQAYDENLRRFEFSGPPVNTDLQIRLEDQVQSWLLGEARELVGLLNGEGHRLEDASAASPMVDFIDRETGLILGLTCHGTIPKPPWPI